MLNPKLQRFLLVCLRVYNTEFLTRACLAKNKISRLLKTAYKTLCLLKSKFKELKKSEKPQHNDNLIINK